MSYTNSVVQFTKIGLKYGLPIDIIMLILSMNDPMIYCDFCEEFFSQMWYERKCEECKISTVKCCNICWKNDILVESGRHCTECYIWWCGMCCKKVVKDFIDVVDSSYGFIDCKCSNRIITYKNYDLTRKYCSKDDKMTKRKI